MNIVKNVGDYLKNLGIQFSVEKIKSNVVLFELDTIDVLSYVQI